MPPRNLPVRRPVSGSSGCSTGSGSRPTPNPPPGSRSGTTVLLRTCPLLDAARRHPEVVCQVHLGLVAGALEAHHEPSDGLRLVPFSRPGPASSPCPPHWCDERRASRCRDPATGERGDVTVVVLAGGTSRRFGADKLGARLHGSTVLETVVGSLPPGWPVVVVGPPRDCGRPVTWTREKPAGGGPLAGVAAGVLRVRTRLVAVVAGDMPYAGPPWSGSSRPCARLPGGRRGRGDRRRRVRQPAARRVPHVSGARGPAHPGGEPPREAAARGAPPRGRASPARPAATSTPPPTSTTSTTSRSAPTRSDRSPSGVGC